MRDNQLAEIRKEAKFLCLMVAQGLAEDDAGPGIAGISACGAAMRMIERREMIVVITGPDFMPRLIPMDKTFKDYMEAAE